eukprot:11574701-Alexandrium_andersonii.AAC.1
MLLLRRVFGREGWGKVKSSEEKHSVTDEALRRKARMPTIASQLRHRRLRMAISFCGRPQHHT